MNPRHYPFSHRRYGLVYPWSVTRPSSFTDFEFQEYRNAFAEPVRLGEDAFGTLGEMLTTNITVPETKINVVGFSARYPLRSTSIPAGWTAGGPVTFGWRYWPTGADFGIPTQRPQHRTSKFAYMITMTTSALVTFSNGTFTHTLSMDGRWTLTTPSTGSDYTISEPLPTLRRQGLNTSVAHSLTSSTLLAYSSSVSGFGSNVVRDYVLGIQATLDTEIAAATSGVVFRVAAVPFGVPAVVPNSSGVNSLEEWLVAEF